jgi:hypothetical protein
VGTAVTASHRPLYSYVGELWVLLCFGFMLFEAGTRIGRFGRAKVIAHRQKMEQTH